MSTISGFSGFNSGLPIDDMITQLMAIERKPINLLNTRISTIKQQQGVYTNVQTKVNDLMLALRKLTTRDFDGLGLFDSMTGSSSNAEIATASVTNQASAQTISLEVKTLPSQTTATSTSGVGAFDNNTLLGNLGITAGTFTVYAEGNPYTITVDPTDTIGSALSAINAAVPDGVIAADPTIVDGKIVLTYTNGTSVSLGSGGDTSNFLEVTHLLTGINDGTGTITASQRNSVLDRTQPLSSAGAGLATALTDGTFTINGISFDTSGKTMNDIIYEINSSDAKVTASYNAGSSTFQLISKDTGSSMISMAEGTGNFLTAMKLVSGANTTASQVAGKNAEFVVNGATMYATGTNVNETVTGLTGVTLNLKQAQPGTTININIQPDTDQLKTAIKDVVDKYNAAITYIDQQTDAKNKMPLAGDNRIKGLRNQLRSLFTSQVGALSGTGYDSLQMVGISTGPIGSTGSSNATPQLKLDESKLMAALSDNPDAVKNLFVAQNLGGSMDGTAFDDEFDGTFTRLHQLLTDKSYVDGNGNTVYGALYLGTTDADRGLFSSYTNSSSKRIEDLNKTIQRTEDRLERKEKTLRQQFLAMDKMVGQYQSQGSALTGLISQLSANNAAK